MIPKAAAILLPALAAQAGMLWPDYVRPAEFAGQIEQETCSSASSPKCWSERAELRTGREHGVGLGQITRTDRFDALAGIRRAHPVELAGWSWQNPYDARLQMRALILQDRDAWDRLPWAGDDVERSAMMLAAYNGGLGGLLADRRICARTPGCDPRRWYGHIEETSLKARTSVSGYGQSFFCVNRFYPYQIMFIRSEKYRSVLAGEPPVPPPPSPARLGCGR